LELHPIASSLNISIINISNYSLCVYEIIKRLFIFTGNLNADDSIEGYELYSSTIADVLSEPSLNTPITVGLYAKWGSGKSFLIKKLVSE